MKTVAISKLKASLSEYIAYVKRGEELVVTEHGKPVARIVPIAQNPDNDSRMQELIRRGVIRPGKGNLAEVLAGLPVIRVPEGTVQRLIDEERKE